MENLISSVFQDLNFIDQNFLGNPNWSIFKNSILKSESSDVEDIFVKSSPNPFDLNINKRDLIYTEMANVWAKNSYCKRMQVGCLIVNNKSIISDGYNGTPTGFPNSCEDENNQTLPLVLHAEANAITKLAKGNQSSEGSTLYVTLSPCFECSKLIIQSGIKRLVFTEVYRNPEPIGFLVQAGIEIIKLTL